MNPLSREAIATAPEFTNWTRFGLVVDALLMRATDDAIRHRNGQHTGLLHEFHSRTTPAWTGCHDDLRPSRASLPPLRSRMAPSPTPTSHAWCGLAPWRATAP